MNDILKGQIWRNVYGARVRIGDLGEVDHDGVIYPVLWVTPCTEDGSPIGGPVPMNPPTQNRGEAGFPGDLWSVVSVGEVPA
jgi:hypothetical protein